MLVQFCKHDALNPRSCSDVHTRRAGFFSLWYLNWSRLCSHQQCCCRPCRHLEEILGLGTMGALQGRVKRHMAAAGLSTLLVSAATAPMFVVQRLARILAVCLRALAESKAFTVSLGFCIDHCQR